MATQSSTPSDKTTTYVEPPEDCWIIAANDTIVWAQHAPHKHTLQSPTRPLYFCMLSSIVPGVPPVWKHTEYTTNDIIKATATYTGLLDPSYQYEYAATLFFACINRDNVCHLQTISFARSGEKYIEIHSATVMACDDHTTRTVQHTEDMERSLPAGDKPLKPVFDTYNIIIIPINMLTAIVSVNDGETYARVLFHNADHPITPKQLKCVWTPLELDPFSVSSQLIPPAHLTFADPQSNLSVYFVNMDPATHALAYRKLQYAHIMPGFHATPPVVLSSPTPLVLPAGPDPVPEPILRLYAFAAPKHSELGDILVLFYLRHFFLYSTALSLVFDGAEMGGPLAAKYDPDTDTLFVIDISGRIVPLTITPPPPADTPPSQVKYPIRVQASYRVKGVDTYYNKLSAGIFYHTPAYFVLHPSHAHVALVGLRDTTPTD